MTDNEKATHAVRLLPKGSDLTLIILKGHLMLEEQINTFLGSFPLRPKALADARLSFLQKLKVIRAFSFGPTERSIRLAEEVNRLRNKIAHHPEVLDLESQVDAFIAMLPDAPSCRPDPRLPRHERLKHAVVFVAGTFSDIEGSNAMFARALTENKRPSKGKI